MADPRALCYVAEANAAALPNRMAKGLVLAAYPEKLVGLPADGARPLVVVG